MAKMVVEAASDKQANDVLLLDAREACSFADYMVICSGDTNRQLEAIRDEIVQVLKKEGILPGRREGVVDSGWVLLDVGNVIVHIFAPNAREFYQLDKLWSNATPVLRIQ